MKSLILYIALFLPTLAVFAQETVPEAGMETQPWSKGFMEGLTAGGFLRVLYFDRNTDIAYDGFADNRTIIFADPADYRDPMLFLYLGGNLSPNSSFGVELDLKNNFTGASPIYDGGIQLYNGLVLRANTKIKDVGGFDVRFGGIEWMNITPFTFGNNTGYQRYSVFNRRPWDPGGNVKQRPASYYHQGTINQDVRFGTNAFKGLMINAVDLPFNMTANLLYGNSVSNSGSERKEVVAPKKIYGGKLLKSLSKGNEIGISTYNTIAYQDSVFQNYDVRKRFHMAEIFGDFNLVNKLNIKGELGYGLNKEPQYKDLGGSAIMFDLKSTKAFTKLPIHLRLYRFDKYFINLDSYVQNTSTTPYLNNFYSESGGVFRPPGAQLTTPGSTVNNRIGAGLNTEFELGKLKVITGLDLSQDIERFNSTNVLSYTHRINGLEITRATGFPYEPGLFGPNNRMGTFYRGAYEVVHVSDTAADGGMSNKLFYSSADVQLKYKTKLFNRDLYFFNLNTFSSVGLGTAIIPDYSGKAYISASYHEFEAYYHIWRDITLSGYYGVEFIKGSDKTDIDVDSQKARDQQGHTIGVGLDYQINNDVFVYVRQSFYSFEDKNFATEKFSGKLLTVELKVFF